MWGGGDPGRSISHVRRPGLTIGLIVDLCYFSIFCALLYQTLKQIACLNTLLSIVFPSLYLGNTFHDCRLVKYLIKIPAYLALLVNVIEFRSCIKAE